MNIEIGIINSVTGKVIGEKTVDSERAMQEAEKISRWFDGQNTFFSGKPIWEHWKILGMLSKFDAIGRGTSLQEIATDSIAVFNGDRIGGEEHEFYVQRVR